MSEASEAVPPYRVVYSGRCRNEIRRALERAQARGRFAVVAQALREIDRRLHWIPLDFGQPIQDYSGLALTEYIGVVAPFVVKYGVDEARRIVHVSLPFGLLPRSGL